MVFGFGKKISGLFSGKKKIDAEFLEYLEELLITSDVSYDVVEELLAVVKKEKTDVEVEEATVKNILKKHLSAMLNFQSVDLLKNIAEHKKSGSDFPYVLLMVGVNGAGKTSTIGKILQLLKIEKLSASVAACDTFRAAAVDQLKIFTDKTGADLIERGQGSNSAGLAYDAVNIAKASGSDVLIIDTAGRLQNREELMAELQKIVKSLNKVCESVPNETYLVIDGTTGQNGIIQAEKFTATSLVSSLVLTKMDSSAKGGIAVSLVKKFGLPIAFSCFGEQSGDIEVFDKDNYLKQFLDI